MARNPVRRQRPAKPVPVKTIGPKPVIGTLLGAAVLLAIGIPWLGGDGSVQDERGAPCAWRGAREARARTCTAGRCGYRGA